MDNEKLVQALIRGVRVFIVAGLTALGLSAANIVDVGTEGSEFAIYAPMILAVIVALIEAALKAIGGPTEPMATGNLRTTSESGDQPAKRPNPLAV